MESGDRSETDETEGDEEGLTYAETGVDVEESEAATAALTGAAGLAGDVDESEDGDDSEGVPTEYAGVLDLGDRYLGLTTDGVGTKLLVARALNDHSTVGVDCVAMNVNDLVAAGLEPVGFVDYLAVAEPDERTAREVGEGLAAGAESAGVRLLGGETAVMPEVVRGLDLAGACVGTAPPDGLLDGDAEPGDRLVGWASSGVHSNGLTLAREAVTREHEYADPFPPEPERTVGEALLEPTRVYADLLGPLRRHARAAAHVTGGGWRNLRRLGDRRYVVDDPHPTQSVFAFVQREGSVTDAEMHRTFNMGTGFVAVAAPEAAERLASDTDGRVIGRIEEGTGVAVRGLEL
ncbi:phosphoribosylformylglycinamidine cyclo-ligase [Halobacteriales archaeon SW_5_70_135]|nr:MAG: phosphoribosylformylglycinamidine cyclo-ligase [Halobacteriales archaeon SW_5_70_135]